MIKTSELTLKGIFSKTVGKTGTWLVDDNDWARVYYCPTEGNNKGFGGRKVTFTLFDGTTFTYTGPDQSNGTAMRNDLAKKGGKE